jgi:uncharacterized phage protein (predicted DNA packaging)
MIITVPEAKSYLRIELDYTAEDTLIQTFIDAAETYLTNMVEVPLETFANNAMAKILCFVLVTDWYENRTFGNELQRVSERVRFTVAGIIAQLKYCYGVVV